MNERFEYGFAHVKDLAVETAVEKNGKTVVKEVLLDGEALEATPRFWTSLHHRFGFSDNIFKYFSHAEVFERISDVAGNDRFRWCIERKTDGKDRLLAVSNPGSAQIRHDGLMNLLQRYEPDDVSYSDGYVRSTHGPRAGGKFHIAGDDFENRFVIDTPIDGFGRPSVYLSLLRLICTNGAIGYSQAFRSELNVGRGDDGVAFALLRVLEGFNNEEGFAALRQRFESATRSWASVNEVNKMYKTLVRLHSRREVKGQPVVPAAGGDGAMEVPARSPLFRDFYKMTGDLSGSYGLANLDALSVKRQRTLPTGCKVYDLLNFTSEVATHHATSAGNRSLQAFLGDLISSEYDLEGTVDHFSDWQDFFIADGATTQTVTDLHRRSRR